MAVQIHINNCFKCKWIKHSNQKTQTEWIQKPDPYICCLKETHFRPKDTYRLKVKGWKNIFHANGEQKRAGVDKADLKIENIARDKEGDNRYIKGSIQEEDITIVNIYAPNILLSRFSRV